MSLPSGYRQLEYIQSTGTQYIDTGFKPNNNTRVLCDIDIETSNATTAVIFGGRDSIASKSFVLWKISATAFRSDFGSSTVQVAVTPTGRHVIDKNKAVCTVDDTSATNTSATFQASYNLTLFAVNGAGTIDSRRVIAKLYSCKVYDNGTLIRDFIPCLKSDGSVGLWDDVNSLFYGNAGPGAFTAGPVKVSSLNLPVNIGGTWKDANEVFVNIGGTWKTVEAAFVNINGTWKELG